jgi:SprT protein
MPKVEEPINGLARFLPPGSYPMVEKYLHQYKIHLTVTRERASVLGDYRHAINGKNHRISVNGNLNPYAFLVTLLHEIAHLLTFDLYGNRVQSHGKEWKHQFSLLLKTFLLAKLFPDDIEKTLLASLHNPAASSCADDALTRVMRKYDNKASQLHLVEELAAGDLFEIKGGRIFKKGEKVRKRIQCTEVSTGRLYLFSPVYEVLKK